MPTKQQLEAMKTYAGIMEEVKIRLSSVQMAASGAFGVPSPLVKEYGFLQIRMTCELIALGCLVAHGDLTATQSRRFQTEYSAGKIMAQLSELHPGFFPRPTVPVRIPGGFHLEDAPPGCMTKDEFIALYGKCGEHLHRGSIKKADAAANAGRETFSRGCWQHREA